MTAFTMMFPLCIKMFIKFPWINQSNEVRWYRQGEGSWISQWRHQSTSWRSEGITNSQIRYNPLPTNTKLVITTGFTNQHAWLTRMYPSRLGGWLNWYQVTRIFIEENGSVTPFRSRFIFFFRLFFKYYVYFGSISGSNTLNLVKRGLGDAREFDWAQFLTEQQAFNV